MVGSGAFTRQFLSQLDEALSEQIHGEHTVKITPIFLYHCRFSNTHASYNNIYNKLLYPPYFMYGALQRKEDQECNHKTEKTHSLGQGKTQDGVCEKLLLQRWITGVADD